MKALLFGALGAALGVAAAEVLLILWVGLSLPRPALIALPFVAGLGTLMIAGRLRAIRLQRAREARRRVVVRRAGEPGAGATAPAHRSPAH